MQLNILLALCLCIMLKVAKAQSCTSNARIGCEEEYGFNFTEETRYFDNRKQLPDAKYLEENCEAFISTGECILDKIKSNSDCQEELKDVWDMVKSAQEKAFELCENTTDLRKNYTESVDCLNEQIATLIQCGRKTWPFIEAEFTDDQLSPVEENDRPKMRYCLANYLQGEVCVCKLAEEECGQGAVSVVRKILDVVFYIPKQICSTLLDKYFENFKEKLDTYNYN